MPSNTRTIAANWNSQLHSVQLLNGFTPSQCSLARSSRERVEGIHKTGLEAVRGGFKLTLTNGDGDRFRKHRACGTRPQRPHMSFWGLNPTVKSLSCSSRQLLAPQQVLQSVQHTCSVRMWAIAAEDGSAGVPQLTRKSKRSPSSSLNASDQQQLLQHNLDIQHVAEVRVEQHSALHDQASPPLPQQQQHQHQQLVQPAQQKDEKHSAIPPEHVWSQEIRHLLGLLSNPNEPLLRQFVLQQCYLLNTPETQQAFRQLTAAAFTKLSSDRHQLEAQVSRAVNALSAAWRRLELLQQAVIEQGAALSEPELQKERELIVGARDRIRNAQRLHHRTVSRASELGDAAFLSRSQAIGEVLQLAAATAEAYLSTGMANIAAASKVNTIFRNAWIKTPQVRRPPPAMAETQRQAQLAPLMPLLPQGPKQLRYRHTKVAAAFQLHKDAAVRQRPPGAGLPSSAGGVFWQNSSAQPPLDGLNPHQHARQYDAGADVVSDKDSEGDGQQDRQEVGQGYMEPPLRSDEAGWQQPPQQLLARPIQQLPLLPHLTKPWVKEQTQRFRQQQQQQQQPQLHKQQQRRHLRATRRRNLQEKSGKELSPSELDDAEQPQTGLAPDLASSRPVCLSGKALPPTPVLFRRALEIEEQLLSSSGNQR